MGGEADLEYTPTVDDLGRHVTGLSPDRVLLLGGADPVGIALAVGDVRFTTPPGPVLPDGHYCFRSDHTVDLLVVTGGSPPGQGVTSAWTGSDDEPLHKAWAWFEFFWAQAKPLGPAATFSPGDWVELAGFADDQQVGRVESSARPDDTWLYKVVVNGATRLVAEDGLLPLSFIDGDVATWLEVPPATARELSVSLTVTKLTNPLTDTIYSYLSSKTIIRPYQFRPVLRLLDSPHQRLLIADEVGLGKTIEAGLIWTELEARDNDMSRVLVVCPSSLTLKWQSEMRRRFDRDLRILDRAGLAELVEILRSGDPDRKVASIVSLERLRSSKLLADLVETQPTFDLIIVDEAHYLRNSGTLSNDLGQLLSEWAETLLFLSATPLNLGTNDLFNLLNLLVPEEWEDPFVFPLQIEPNRYLNRVAASLLANRAEPRRLLPILDEIHECTLGGSVVVRPEFHELRRVLDADSLSWAELAEAKLRLAELNTLSSVLSRTRKVDVPDAKAVREVIQIDVDWDDSERLLYHAIRKWALDRAEELDAPPGFITQMPLRQAASCLHAAKSHLESKDPIGFSPLHGDDLDDFTFDEDFDPDDEVFLDVPTGPLLRSALAGLGPVDSKLEGFKAVLRAAPGWGRGQVLLFSFFRGTLGYLEANLRDEWRVRVMHGGTPQRDRQEIMDSFRRGDFDILLTSEVASEGLDFEFCNVVVNYDLPWNPMKVEQRIGRLDRFGQTHEKIFIVNFHVPDTIETRIFSRLYERIDLFHQSIGELEPIMRQDFAEVSRMALNPQLSDAQRERRLSEIEVALEQRTKDLANLEEAQTYLAGIDQLLIDGFEQDTRSRGRFIGPDELRILLQEFFGDGTRARLHPIKDTSSVELIGDAELGDRVARWGVSGTGSRFSAIQLAPRLRDGEPIVVTFDNQEASHSNADLISLRHPLVRAAVRHFEQRPFPLKRYGSVRLTDASIGDGSWLVVLYLAETTGLKPSLEIWPIAVEVEAGEVASDEVGFALLAAVAAGTLADGSPPDQDRLRSCLAVAEGKLHQTQVETERQRRRVNESLVNARIATQQASYAGKISRAQDTLDTVRHNRRGRSVVRMNEGRVNNLTLKRDAVLDDLEKRRQLALSTRPIAIVHVSSGNTR